MTARLLPMYEVAEHQELTSEALRAFQRAAKPGGVQAIRPIRHEIIDERVPVSDRYRRPAREEIEARRG